MAVFATGFAEALDPELHPDALSVLAQVEAALGRETRAAVTEVLQEMAARLAAPEITVVFAGRFSSGKSTLVNALLGWNLLPTGNYPETGVPCRIRPGARQLAGARYRSGEVRPIACTVADISRVITLTDDDGAVRTQVRDVAELAVTLPTRAIAPGICWVDTPGADDGGNDASNLRTSGTEAVAAADVLVWVTRSDVAMGLHEMALLDAYVAEHGPAGAILVVNVILQDDSPVAYREVLARRGAGLRRRARDADERRGVEIAEPILLAARPLARAGAGFGGEALWAVLGDPVQLARRARAARLFQAVQTVDGLAGPVGQAIEEEQAALRKHADAQRAAVTSRCVDDERFAQILGVFLGDSVSRCRGRLSERADEAAATGGADACEEALRQAVDDELAALRTTVQRQVAALCHEHMRTPPTTDENAHLTGLLTVGRPTIPRQAAAPAVSGREAAAAAAAVAGTVLGAVLLGPFGAAAAGALGGALVKSQASATPAPDTQSLPRSAAAAAGAAADEIDGKRPAMVGFLLTCCRPGPPGETNPDTARLDALLALLDGILGPARRMLAREGR